MSDLVFQQNQSLFSRITIPKVPRAISPENQVSATDESSSLKISPLPYSTGPMIPKHNRRQLFIMTSSKKVNTDSQSSASSGGSTQHDSPKASHSPNASNQLVPAEPQSACSPSFEFDPTKGVFKFNQEAADAIILDSESSEPEAVEKKSKICLAKSQCFLVILKYYALDHKAHEVAKLQLLNKRCYDYFVPQLMSRQNLKLEMSPCLLNFFEADVQKQIVEKKESGTKMRNGHVLTLKFDRDFPRKQDAAAFVQKYLEAHPNFSTLFAYTGEHWQILCHRYTRSTVFKFVSKNLQTKEGTYYTKIGSFEQKQLTY